RGLVGDRTRRPPPPRRTALLEREASQPLRAHARLRRTARRGQRAGRRRGPARRAHHARAADRRRPRRRRRARAEPLDARGAPRSGPPPSRRPRRRPRGPHQGRASARRRGDPRPRALRLVGRGTISMTEPVADEATEAIDGGGLAFVHPRGTILLVISAHKAHANFTVTPSAKEAFAAELEGLETGKGSVKLPYEVSSLAHGIRSGRGIGRPQIGRASCRERV